jgi:hypothetical protein
VVFVTELNKFHLEFITREKHLMLPNITSIILVQNLYDILFQYVITKEKEEKLKKFIELLESHIKSKSRAPFSIPLTELEFLNEGLQELKLLNWIELPVYVFKIVLDDQIISEEEMEKIFNLLQNIFTYNRKKDSNTIYVYPIGLTQY